MKTEHSEAGKIVNDTAAAAIFIFRYVYKWGGWFHQRANTLTSCRRSFAILFLRLITKLQEFAL